MPILPAEPMCFPEALFTEGEEIDTARVWWVLHTRPRQEKKLAEYLRGQGIPYFLPLARKRLVIRGVARHSHLPLFPSYLFLQADAHERIVALSSRRLVQVLPVPNQERLHEDLRQIHQLIQSGLPVTPEQTLAPGSPVEIVSGPLSGLRGQVIRTASGQRLLVRVDFIQQGASVLLNGCDLVPLRGAAG